MHNSILREIQYFFHKYTLLVVISCFILGVLAGLLWLVAWQLVVAMLLLLSFLVVLSWRKQNVAGLLPLFWWSGLVLANIAVLAATPLAADLAALGLDVACGENLLIEAMVIDNAVPQADQSIAFVVQVQRINGCPVENMRLMAYCESDKPFFYGAKVMIEGAVLPLHSLNNPGSFDYEQYLARQGIDGAVSTKNQGGLQVLTEQGDNGLLQLVAKSYYNFNLALEQLPLSEGGFIRGVFLGDKSGLDSYNKDVLAKTGLLHAFAVSGMHVSFLVAFALLLGSVVGNKRYLNTLLVLLFLGFYLLLTGITPSVLRASVMAVIVVLAYLIHEQPNIYNCLFIAAAVCLLANPYALLDAGFQLSFISAFGIVYFNRFLRGVLPGGGWCQFLVLPCSVLFWTVPVVAYYFSLVSWSGLLLSVLVLPAIEMVVILSVIAVMLALFSAAWAAIPLFGAGLLMTGVYGLADWVANLPGSHWVLPQPPVFLMLLYYLFLLLLPWAGRWLGKSKTVVLTVALLVVFVVVNGICHYYSVYPYQDMVAVTFLDVGNGDCILLRTAGQQVLIDGGGTFGNLQGVGINTLMPYLRSQGIGSLDLIINTHPHEDHVGGLLTVLERMPVELLAVGSGCLGNDLGRDLLTLAQEQHVPVQVLHTNDRIQLEEDCFLEVMTDGDDYLPADLNSASVVLKLHYQDTAILLTGDVDAYGRLGLRQKNLQADVLQLPHHGSSAGYDPVFYQQVNPKAVVLSAANNDRFRDPACDIIKYWQKCGVPIYATYQQGAVTVYSDGQQIYVDCYQQQK